MTPAEKAEWNRVKREPRTREDWADLHDTIEQYRRRLMARHASGDSAQGEDSAVQAT